MRLPDVTDPVWFLIATVIAFAVILGRYFLIAGLFYCIFYLWAPKVWIQRKINSRKYPQGQFSKEVWWSSITAAIFAVSASFTLLLWQCGYTHVYADLRAYPLWW